MHPVGHVDGHVLVAEGMADPGGGLGERLAPERRREADEKRLLGRPLDHQDPLAVVVEHGAVVQVRAPRQVDRDVRACPRS